ncbi:tRNA (adenosine(37)-N6)-dimethylallyltransferase MiaA [Candidatus Peregrinibacteria bacterium]|nr:tRNA (adenosine(37)-N6)-dimethylallyltransferase MiaA [Candidatus Peregrinibacteria bacterium]
MNIIEEIKSLLKTSKKPLIVILGPTASGKTDISLKIASEINGEIISTDSRQIYKEMEIGTEAVGKDEQKNIPHHMIGIKAPDEVMTLAQYKEESLKIIDEIYKRKHIPILVGGTGLYISSIIEGYDIPKVKPNEKLRKKLQKEAKEKGNKFIHKKLKKLDPLKAEKIHENNSRYVIRAIEISMAARKKKSNKKKNPQFELFKIGIKWPREQLYERINKRVDIQLQKGLLNEVKQLVEKGYDENLPSMSSLGVKEIIPYIKGKTDLNDCLETLRKNTRRYAKRQMTWFRRYDNVRWLTPKEVEKIVNG